ncbi:MAG: LCP family protein [Actinobacteria bacterium]|nr:LCP family protein [Actinomycetota bacterium]MCB9427388.1 LCP family protein [Actinomycetota bacterium]MCO5298487.1 LCP family protein [Candidatus Nanopelagicales bacterium]
MAARRRRWPRVLAGVASTFVLLATGAAAAGAVLYDRLDSNINTLDTTDQLGTRPARDAAPSEPINILVMGSDSRTGKGNNKKYGNANNAGIEGQRSDTTLLFHISGDRTRALGMSIPRDSLVTLPTCKNRQGQQQGGYTGRFNEAFDIGGPGCTIKAVEELTGIYVDHFVVVDFNGFKKMVDAVDGVEICLEKPVNDYHARLDLPAGKQTISGEDALAFVRARETLGDGSDIQRIQRQQDFISSMIRKVTSAGVLTNPIKLFNLLDAGTKSLTTDQNLSDLSSIQGIAESMVDIRPSDITFVTVPFTYNDDMSTVSWDQAKADRMFKAIINDKPWPEPPTVPPGQDPLTVPPQDIDVIVVNGTPQSGFAAIVADDLTAQGYNVVGTRSSDKDVAVTRLSYSASKAEAARTLAYAAGATQTKVKGGSNPTMVLKVGEDYTGIKPVVTKKKKDPLDTSAPKTADSSICVS